VDGEAFRREQDRLGRVWTFLALTAELARDGDWVRRTLGGRSVFVQRSGTEIAAFENVCPHRFHPLRTAEQGNGPILCGFHHWKYDGEGHAVDVPLCLELYGKTPREMSVRLRRLETATCGGLIFGRFAGGDGESLETYLAGSAPILAAMTAEPGRPLQRLERIVEANWRLMVSITLDDYHIVAVHGRKSHMRPDQFRTWRFGRHSAYVIGEPEQTLQSMAAQCVDGSYRPRDYRILNIFPNLAVSLFNTRPYWYANIQQFEPLAPGRTRWRSWFHPTPLAAAETPLQRLTRPLFDPMRNLLVRRGVHRVGEEDHRTCEHQQEVAHQAGPRPLLGRQEERVGWFLESYDGAVAG